MAEGKYDHKAVEAKWQKKWEEEKLYMTPSPKSGKKKYILDMFPYPSGATMHVGHLEGYVGTDILCRYLRMKGFLVLHPMGWDAFGLPAENYAIKTGIHPHKSTHENINTFKLQLLASGLSYDWTREIDTSSPEYYKWTQWLFIQLFKKGLAYKKKAKANWCPKDKTVLANEQVVNGKCERCEAEVMQKELDQWFFKITDYADRLVEGLDKLDWLDEVKTQQINWVGRKEGIEIKFQILNSKSQIAVFTTTPVNFAATFLVLSPEHPLVSELTKSEHKMAVEQYCKLALEMKPKDRIAKGRKKTGVFTGSYVVNHVNGELLPIWISDFVLMDVGTGAIQACPGHDLRDFEFAKKFNLPIKRVVIGTDGDSSPIDLPEQVVEHGGTMTASEFLNGLPFAEAMEKTKDYFEQKNWGKRVVTYHLRDWLVSRQRYWGTPIPMVWCDKCKWQPVPEDQLPVKLPDDVDFEKNARCSVCGGEAKRETDTMDGFVDNSWYFIRFADSHNKNEFVSKAAARAWLPVDIYVGGGHVVQHLLYARFFWKVLLDVGLLDKSLGEEPFLKLRAPGWILGPDSRKMSKRWGNVVTPDEVIGKFGADTLRVYEMFIGPFETMKPWIITGVEGVARFLGRIYRLFEDTYQLQTGQKVSVERIMNKLIKKVGEDIKSMNFNTAIAAMMKAYNQLMDIDKERIDWKWVWGRWTVLLAPFAPHLAEELWFKLGHSESVHLQTWPEYNPELAADERGVIVVQVNGKVRDRVVDGPDVQQRAVESDKVKKYLGGAKYRTIYVPGKIINFVCLT